VIGRGYTEFAGFLVVHQKTTRFFRCPQSQDRRTEDGDAAASDRSDQCSTMQSRIFKAEDMRLDRKACIEAKQVCGSWASVRWCEDKDFEILP
jgi:hypothetical protein